MDTTDIIVAGFVLTIAAMVICGLIWILYEGRCFRKWVDATYGTSTSIQWKLNNRHMLYREYDRRKQLRKGQL